VAAGPGELADLGAGGGGEPRVGGGGHCLRPALGHGGRPGRGVPRVPRAGWGLEGLRGCRGGGERGGGRRARGGRGAVGAARGRGAWLTLWALGLSGAVSMVYEVAWTRALAQVIGSSTYAFTAMLVAFLLGIAGGAALYARFRGDRSASPTDFALVQAGI